MKLFVAGFFRAIYLLPKSMQRGVAHAIAFLWYDIIRLRRKMVHEHIKLCFPELTGKEVRRIARASFLNQGQIIVDFANMLYMEPSKLLENCSFENIEILENVLKDGKGAMLLGCHLSNGDYGIAGLSQRKLPMNLVAKNFKTQALDTLLYDTRHRFGTKTLAARQTSFQILKALKRNEVVIFVLDQFMGPPIGVPTTFFGHPTGTAMALAMFALKTKVPVVPCYTYRKEDGSYCVHFEDLAPTVEGATEEESIQKTSQAYNDILETFARKYPEQWLWLHRRWKLFKY